MAVAILLGALGFLVAGVVVVACTAALTRREREDLDEAFAAARGHALEPDAEPAPWSTFDLAVLRDDVVAIDPRDPFATLKRVSSSISWHVPSNGNGSEPKPIVWRAPVEAA